VEKISSIASYSDVDKRNPEQLADVLLAVSDFTEMLAAFWHRRGATQEAAFWGRVAGETESAGFAFQEPMEEWAIEFLAKRNPLTEAEAAAANA
jgi:hypothetical protein